MIYKYKYNKYNNILIKIKYKFIYAYIHNKRMNDDERLNLRKMIAAVIGVLGLTAIITFWSIILIEVFKFYKELWQDIK